jgi:sulfite exporter TauE/SafE
MISVLMQGLLLGLSTGPLCLATCGPVFAPLLMAEERQWGSIARVIGELALGRLLAYLAFGAGVGYLGVTLQGPLLDKVVGGAMVVLALCMFLYVVVQGWPHLPLCRVVNPRFVRFPILLGLLTGINICPPFLLAISSALGLGSLALGIALFGGFFLGTSVYLLALVPLGYLGRWPNLRLVALMTAVLVGVVFLVMGVVRLVTA